MRVIAAALLAGSTSGSFVTDPLAGNSFVPLVQSGTKGNTALVSQCSTSKSTSNCASISSTVTSQVIQEFETASASSNPDGIETRAISPQFGFRIQSPNPAVTALSFGRAAADASQILTCSNPNVTLTTTCMTSADYQLTTLHVQDILNAFTGTDRADFAGCILRMAGAIYDMRSTNIYTVIPYNI